MSQNTHRKVSAYPEKNQTLARKIATFERFPDKPYTQLIEAIEIARIYLLERCHPTLLGEHSNEHNRQHAENIMSAFHWRNTAKHLLGKTSLEMEQKQMVQELLGQLDGTFEQQQQKEGPGHRELIEMLGLMPYVVDGIKENRPQTTQELMDKPEL